MRLWGLKRPLEEEEKKVMDVEAKGEFFSMTRASFFESYRREDSLLSWFFVLARPAMTVFSLDPFVTHGFVRSQPV